MSGTTLYAFVGDEKAPPRNLNPLEKIGLKATFTPSTLFPPERMWEGAKRVYGDVADMPEGLPLLIWGKDVVDVRRVENCPKCGWAGEIYVLCPYHFDRQCPDCLAINGTVAPCRCP